MTLLHCPPCRTALLAPSSSSACPSALPPSPLTPSLQGSSSRPSAPQHQAAALGGRVGPSGNHCPCRAQAPEECRPRAGCGLHCGCVVTKTPTPTRCPCTARPPPCPPHPRSRCCRTALRGSMEGRPHPTHTGSSGPAGAAAWGPQGRSGPGVAGTARPGACPQSGASAWWV